MNFKLKHVLLASAFVAAGGVHAEVKTFAAGEQIMHEGWALTAPGGMATFQFSSTLIAELNLIRATAEEVQPADLQVLTTTITSSLGEVRTRFISGSAAAPVTSLTGDFGDHTVTMQAMKTNGGFTFGTFRNAATSGSGFLSVTNIQVDLLTKNVYADITGGNGVGTMLGYHLWSFHTQSEPLVLSVGGYLTPGYTYSSNEVTVSGLFAPMAAMDMMQQALNLNSIGRAGLNSVNDPSRHGGVGFGTLVLTAVPEPSTNILVCAGVMGLGLMARRTRRVGAPTLTAARH